MNISPILESIETKITVSVLLAPFSWPFSWTTLGIFTLSVLNTTNSLLGESLRTGAYTASMLPIALAIILVSSLTPLLNAQDLQGKISCWDQGNQKPPNRAYTKKLWDGYEISLGPTPHAAENPG